MPDSEKARRRGRYIIVTTVLCLSIVLGLLAGNYNAVSEALAPYFTRQPARLTELYFTNYNSMPKFLNAGETYPIDFTIVNHESRDTTYSYRVTAIENSLTRTLASGFFSLSDGEHTERRVFFKPIKPGANDEIIVDLLNKKQRVTYSAQNNY